MHYQNVGSNLKFSRHTFHILLILSVTNTHFMCYATSSSRNHLDKRDDFFISFFVKNFAGFEPYVDKPLFRRKLRKSSSRNHLNKRLLRFSQEPFLFLKFLFARLLPALCKNFAIKNFYNVIKNFFIVINLSYRLIKLHDIKIF